MRLTHNNLSGILNANVSNIFVCYAIMMKGMDIICDAKKDIGLYHSFYPGSMPNDSELKPKATDTFGTNYLVVIRI